MGGGVNEICSKLLNLLALNVGGHARCIMSTAILGKSSKLIFFLTTFLTLDDVHGGGSYTSFRFSSSSWLSDIKFVFHWKSVVCEFLLGIRFDTVDMVLPSVWTGGYYWFYISALFGSYIVSGINILGAVYQFIGMLGRWFRAGRCLLWSTLHWWMFWMVYFYSSILVSTTHGSHLDLPLSFHFIIIGVF